MEWALFWFLKCNIRTILLAKARTRCGDKVGLGWIGFGMVSWWENLTAECLGWSVPRISLFRWIFNQCEKLTSLWLISLIMVLMQIGAVLRKAIHICSWLILADLSSGQWEEETCWQRGVAFVLWSQTPTPKTLSRYPGIMLLLSVTVALSQ